MRQRAQNALRRIQALTEAKCRTCPSGGPNRCCDDTFCQMVERGLRAAGLEVPVTGNRDVRFLGPAGCVVPPEHRPGCSGFVCDEHLKDRGFRREWVRLHERYVADPKVKLLMSGVREDSRRMFGAAARDLVARVSQ